MVIHQNYHQHPHGIPRPMMNTTRIKSDHNTKEIEPFHTSFPVVCRQNRISQTRKAINAFKLHLVAQKYY